MIISTATNISNYFSLETKPFDMYEKEATISIASQPIVTWDANYTIASQQVEPHTSILIIYHAFTFFKIINNYNVYFLQ